MRRWLMEIIGVVLIVLLCVFLFGENLTDVLTEMAIFYGVLAVVGIVLGVCLLWGMSQAMNRRGPP